MHLLAAFLLPAITGPRSDRTGPVHRLKLDGMTARFRLQPASPPGAVDGGLMYECAGDGDLSRTVVLSEEDLDEPADEVEVDARLLVLFHQPRDEFRGFVEVRLMDVQVVTP